MIKDKFKFTPGNIILIFVNIILIIIVIFSAIQLISSLREESGIPNLTTTAGKQSTLEADKTQTKETETVPTTVTKKQGKTSSPYYDYDYSSLLTDSLCSNSNISTKEDQKKLIEIYFGVLKKIVDPTDNELLDIENLLSNVKSGEKDAITVNNYKYGMIYDYSTLMKTVFYKGLEAGLEYYKRDGVAVFTYSDGNFYRIQQRDTDKKIEVQRYDLSASMGTNEIYGKVVFYDINYKELGYTTPNYDSVELDLKFDSDAGKWKINSFSYPHMEA